MIDMDRVRGCLLGLAVGDALGVPLEFAERDAQPEVRDMIGGGPFDLQPGEWSDDTSMALCLADSLLANGWLDQHDLMRRFVRWWRHGENSVNGRCFDIGMTTESALARFEMTGVVVVDPDPRKAGNGSLMRLAPVAIFARGDADLAEELARRQSEVTHGAPQCVDACRFYARLLSQALSGAERRDMFGRRSMLGDPEVTTLILGGWRRRRREAIMSSGYVVHTLEAALWSVGTTCTFEDALIKAVNLAGDADTIGAVAGQLAGAFYGARAIPERWLAPLAAREKLAKLAIELSAAGRTG